MIRALLRFFLPVLALTALGACDSSPSGDDGSLVIEDISIGSGEAVADGQTLMVSYVGTLVDGTVFDSSELKGKPLLFTLGVGNVVEGLDLGIQGMNVGGVRRITIPPHLAFGRSGMCLSEGDCPVPKNAIVTFEITIDDILDYVLIEDLEVGPGELVGSGDEILIAYLAVLQDGTIVDSSEQRGTLLKFTLGAGHVIEGLEEGIPGMRVGGVRVLTIPPVLAFGEEGNPSSFIPPYAILRFRIELADLVPPGS